MRWARILGVVLLCFVFLLGSPSCTAKGEAPQGDNQSTQNGVAMDTTPPGSPTDLARTTPDDDNTPTFTWVAATDDDSGIARYLLRMDGGVWVDIGNVTKYTCGDAISDGSHTLELKAVDHAGNEGSEGSCTFTCDTTPPAISNMSVTVTTTSSALINWWTDESATSQVEWGTSSSYGSSSTLNTSLVTVHTVKLTGLTPGATYHYRVKSRDAAGNETTSGESTFVAVETTHSVYCVGDSLTAADVYEAKLRDLLGSAYTVVNKGVGSAHTSYMLSQFSTDVLSDSPDFVVIWGGINNILHGDSLAATQSDLQSMYTQAHNQGIRVIAVSLSPCKGCSEWTEDAQAQIDQLNTWIATTAIDVDYRIDVYSLLEDPSNPDCLLWPDYGYGGGGLHLSTAGYYVVGQAIYDGTAAFHG